METVEELIIGEYPEPMTSSLNRVYMPSVVVLEQPSASSENLVTVGPKSTPGHHQSAAVPEEDQLGSASALSDDPHHLDLIVSYDVIDEEVSTATDIEVVAED